MAVPNTTTFTLQDVVDEINPTTDDLVDCFADADSAKFDPTYSSTKDELLHFRNYNGRILFHIGGLGDAHASSGAACGDTYLVKYYHDGIAILPKDSDVVYTAPTGATAFVGGNFWYVMGGYTMQIDNFGVVSNKTVCVPV